jgi:phage-related protein
MRGRLRGVIELSKDDPAGTYRVYYTQKCPGIIHVLFCHKKKSKQGGKIPKHEEDLIVQRLKDALSDCGEYGGNLR